jgi:orotate phosphoribosyltransferase
VYLNSARVIRFPGVVRELVTGIWLPALETRGVRPDWIVGYAPYTGDLALALAGAAETQYAWAGRGDKQDGQGRNIFVSDFFTEADAGGTAVLLADDLVSGGSLDRTAEALANRGIEVVGPVLCIGNMSGKSDLHGQEIVSAATFDPDPQMYSVEACRAEGFCSIGSVAISRPRELENWNTLQQHTAGPVA